MILQFQKPPFRLGYFQKSVYFSQIINTPLTTSQPISGKSFEKDQKTAFYVSNLNLKGTFEEAFMQGVFMRSDVKDLGGDVDEETTINLLRFFYQKKKNS